MPCSKRGGFVDIGFDRVDATLHVGPDADHAFASVRKMGVVDGLLRELEGSAREGALGRLWRTIEEHLTPEGVLFGSSSWLVRASTAR